MDIQADRRSTLDWAGNIAAYVLVIVVNTLANVIPIGGRNTGQVSADYPTLFTPAGFTFSIWGVIYLALAVFVVYQALPGQRKDALLARLDTWFKVNCVANAAWIFAWHYEQLGLSLMIMLVLLGSLVVLYSRIGSDLPGPFTTRWVSVALPFSLYAGWITVATLANLSIVQVAGDWQASGLTEVNWTLLKLGVAGFVAVTVGMKRGDFAFMWVFSWAAFGITVNQAGTPEVVGGAMVLYFITLFAGVWALGGSIIMRRWPLKPAQLLNPDQ